jgi:hypothetical protein
MQPRYRPELPRNKWPNPDEQKRLIHCGSLSQVVPTNSAASIVEAVIARASVYSVMTALGQNRKSSMRTYVFRIAPESGHRAMASPFRAMSGNYPVD